MKRKLLFIFFFFLLPFSVFADSIDAPLDEATIATTNTNFTFTVTDTAEGHRFVFFEEQGIGFCSDTINGYTTLSRSMEGWKTACASGITLGTGAYHLVETLNTSNGCSIGGDYATCIAGASYGGQDICLEVDSSGACSGGGGGGGGSGTSTLLFSTATSSEAQLLLASTVLTFTGFMVLFMSMISTIWILRYFMV